MKGRINTETHRLMGEIYEYAPEVNSGAMVYISKQTNKLRGP
jgi:hypothetical protein